MKYLVKTTSHDTGEVFRDVIKLKENETYEVVEADNKEEAEKIASRHKGLLEVVPSSFNNNPISEVFSEASVNVNGQRGIGKSLTNEQVQKLIELAKEKKGQ